jgi:hypothetical protein
LARPRRTYATAMTAWEFTYVDLWLGEVQDVRAVNKAQEQIAALGRDGWEPVGPVNFLYHQPNKVLGADTNVGLLMFKRPARDPS